MARNNEEAKLRKKEYDRKRREEVKKDPENLAEMREKERLKYHKKREKGKLSAKLVASMSSREHRQIKKEWRKRSRTYRIKKKDQQKLNQILMDNSPPPLPASIVSQPYNPTNDVAVTPSTSNASFTSTASTSRKNVGRKRVKKSRSKMYRTIVELKHRLMEAKKSAEKYRKSKCPKSKFKG